MGGIFLVVWMTNKILSARKKPAGLAGFATGSTLTVPLTRLVSGVADKRPYQISASMPHNSYSVFLKTILKYTLTPP